MEQSWLTRNVKVLSGVSLLQDAASELLYPVLPIFLTSVLGAPVAAVGLVEGLAEGVASVTKLTAGALADRMPRKLLIGAGYGLAAVGKLVIALSGVWGLVLAGRAIDRVGKGIRGAPRDALLVQDIPQDRRGAVFGFHRMADTVGAVIGPLIGLGLYEALSHRIRPLLWIAVIPALASVALVAAVREKNVPAEKSRHPHAAGAGGWRELPRQYWLVFGALTLFSAVNFPDALLLLRAHQEGLSTAGTILLYAVYNTVYAAASYPAGALSDRLPRGRVYAVGLVFFAIGYLGLAFAAHSTLAIFLVLAAYGGFNACTDGVGKAWVSSMAPAGLQGTAQGLFQGATGGAILLAGVWAGLLWGYGDHGHGTLPLLISGTAGAFFAVLLFLTPRMTTTTKGDIA